MDEVLRVEVRQPLQHLLRDVGHVLLLEFVLNSGLC